MRAGQSLGGGMTPRLIKVIQGRGYQRNSAEDAVRHQSGVKGISKNISLTSAVSSPPNNWVPWTALQFRR
jgi:hypothetical protein